MDDGVQPAVANDLTAWFGEQPLSTRARNRLLAGVQGEDGQLRDLDREGFLAELRKPRGGRLGEIPGLGKGVLDEVKRVFLVEDATSSPATNGVHDDLPALPLPPDDAAANEPAPAVAEMPSPDGADGAAAALSGPQDAPGRPRRRGRPRGADTPAPEPAEELATPAAEGLEHAAADAVPPGARARRGPRRGPVVSDAAPPPVAAPGPAGEATAPPAPALATTPANGENDPALERLMAIWPRLHRQGKAAVVVFAADIAVAE